MSEGLNPGEASRALTEIQRHQERVIDVATVPPWYWSAVGALMVVLAVGVDTRTPLALGITVPVFVVGLLAATALAVLGQFSQARLHNSLIDGAGVLAILAFVAIIVGGTIGIAYALRAGGVAYPATLGCTAGGLAMGFGGPVLMRLLRAIMLSRRAGSPR